MGPKPDTPKSNDLFRQRLDELINPRHPLAQLARHIDWVVFERKWAGFFPSSRGRPATSPRLVARLLYLQHTFALSDEEVVWGWVENPYWQLFCGETWFQHHPHIDPSSLTRWRQRIGKEGMEWLLAQTICAAASAKVKPCSPQAGGQECPLCPCQAIQAHAQPLKEAQDIGRPGLARCLASIGQGAGAPQAQGH